MYVELLDAGVEGAGLITSFTRVMQPLSIPAFVVVGICQFANIWNDFLFGITAVPNPASQEVTSALNNLSGTSAWTGTGDSRRRMGRRYPRPLSTPDGPVIQRGHSSRCR